MSIPSSEAWSVMSGSSLSEDCGDVCFGQRLGSVLDVLVRFLRCLLIAAKGIVINESVKIIERLVVELAIVVEVVA